MSSVAHPAADMPIVDIEPLLSPAATVDARDAVARQIDAACRMNGIALGLGIPSDWFARNLTDDPTVLFRIFHYPAESAPAGSMLRRHPE